MRGARLSLWKKAIFATVVTAVFFGVLEVVLWIAGVDPIAREEDPYVGFSSWAPLFVEESGPDGERVMVTAPAKLKYFNRQRFAREPAPGTRRVFCLGGSTTFGRPYDDTTSFCGWLRELLPEADPSSSWEVINAGGISYASYRVAKLMDELTAYRPDLFVVYTGHNEFLERRTYATLVATPEAVRGLGAVLARTRTFTVLRRLVSPSRTDADSAASPAVERLPAEVATILDRSVGPSAYRRDDEFRRRVFEHFRYNVERMVEIARSCGARIVFVTPASNLRDCSPFKSERRDGLSAEERGRFDDHLGAATAAHRDGENRAALERLDHSLALDDRHAGAWFLRGRVLLALGRTDDARVAFDRARDEDVCPLRAPPEIRRTIVETASRLDVPVVDFAARVEDVAQHGIPGEDVFLDHVHPTIAGNRMLALAILDWMAAAALVTPRADWGEEDVARVARRVEEGLDRGAHAAALRNLAQVLQWAGKEEESGRIARRAAELAPDDAESQYLAGCDHQRLGDTARAEACYRRALELNPRYFRAHNNLGLLLADRGDLSGAVAHFRRATELRSDFAEAHHNLGVALERAGDLAAAIASEERAIAAAPEFAEAHAMLGKLLARGGDLDAAVAAYRRAIAIDDGFAEAHHNLGIVRARQSRLDAAAACFRRALEIRPEYESARRNLARAEAILAGEGR